MPSTTGQTIREAKKWSKSRRMEWHKSFEIEEEEKMEGGEGEDEEDDEKNGMFNH
jgi:hypothetical protein